MVRIERLYDAVLREHLESSPEMAFVSGPRQVGKTTTSAALGSCYLNWDTDQGKAAVLAGSTEIRALAGVDVLGPPPVIVFDELHKFSRWKSFLKGFFDELQSRARIIVTGSARLDVYRRGGDSLLGRYLLYRMHPLSVGEVLDPTIPRGLLRPPRSIGEEQWNALRTHGGFPAPFLRRDTRFTNRWRRHRREQLLTDDIRDLTRVVEVSQIEHLGRLLGDRSGQRLVISELAREVKVSPNTAKSWLETLRALYYGFTIRPWHRNLEKALRKETKWYLWDWAGAGDGGKREEAFAASHLLKAVHGWTDLGLGEFDLYYIRDKAGREVDFLVTRDGDPWFLVEVKRSDTRLSPHLQDFQMRTGAQHAFQIVFESDYVDFDPFERAEPVIVPAQTLLSVLL